MDRFFGLFSYVGGAIMILGLADNCIYDGKLISFLCIDIKTEFFKLK